MDDQLRRRIADLEARLGRLEARLDGMPSATPPAAPPILPPPLPAAATPVQTPPGQATPPPSLPPAARPAPPRLPPAPPFDLERFLGLAVLGRIGIAAVVLAAVYFGQLGWGQLAPAARTAAIYGGAALLLGLGQLLRTRAAPRYIAMLWGGSLALASLAGLLARLHYQCMNSATALAALVATAALGQLLARVLELQAMAVLALALAFAAPVLVGDPSPTPTAFYGYLLVLHTWAAVTERRWQWRACRALAVTATAVLALGWLATSPPIEPAAAVLHLHMVLLGLLMPELWATLAGTAPGPTRQRFAWIGAWVAQVGLVLDAASHAALPAFGLCVGGSWLAFGALAATRLPATHVAVAAGWSRLGGVLAMLGAVVLGLDPIWPHALAEPRELGPLLALAAVGALLLLLHRWTKASSTALACGSLLGMAVLVRATTASAELQPLRPLVPLALALPAATVWWAQRSTARAIALWAAGLAALYGLAGSAAFRGEPSATPWATIGLGTAGVLAAVAALRAAARQDRVLLHAALSLLVGLGLDWARRVWFADAAAADARDLMPFVNFRFAAAGLLLGLLEVSRRRLPAEPRTSHAVFGGVELLLAYLAGLVELLTWVQDWPRGSSDVTVSLYSLAVAAALLTAGFVRGAAWLRWPGLLGLVAVVLKVATYDLAALETPLRVLVTLVLGIVLLLGAWLYARRRPTSAPPAG